MLRPCLTRQAWMVWYLLCNLGWPQTGDNSSVSDIQALGCATTANLKLRFLKACHSAHASNASAWEAEVGGWWRAILG